MDAKRFVLDYLRYSPAPVETLFAAAADSGLSRDEITDAACSLNVMTAVRTRDGIRCAILPANLAAIWWGRRAPARHHYGSAA
jgi:hypothetical protein